jgi:hypothetical protein
MNSVTALMTSHNTEGSELESLRLLGREFAIAISKLLEGKCNVLDTLMASRFDYKRWRKGHPAVFPNHDKSEILAEVAWVIETAVIAWVEDVCKTPDELLREYSRPVYLGVCSFLANVERGLLMAELVEGDDDERGTSSNKFMQRQTARIAFQPVAGPLCAKLKTHLRNSLAITHIRTLTGGGQRQLMRWIFRNEDRVWRTLIISFSVALEECYWTSRFLA